MRLALLCILAFFVATQSGYAQRVYADTTQTLLVGRLLGAPLSQVTAPLNAINSSDNYSTLQINVGLLSLVSASQNLRFSYSTQRPQPTSPLMIRFRMPSAVLGLLDNISIQRTNGGILNSVGELYSGSTLLSLLSTGAIQEAIVPVPGSTSPSDGLRFTISSTLSVALSAQLYYAFYITPPTLSTSTIPLCQGATGQIQITNRQVYNNVPYTYRLYTAELGGTEVAGVTASTTSTLNIPASLAAGTYWVEAREGNLYPSARTQVVITRSPLPIINIGTIPTICEGDNQANIPFTVGTTAPNQYQITWNLGTPAGFTNVPWTNLPTTGAHIPIPIPTTAPMGEYSGILRARRTVTGCLGADTPITVRIRPTPGRPHMTITEVLN